MKFGRSLITFTLVATMVLPILTHWNPTHVFNPTWPGHARFHVALGDCMMFSYSVVGLWLLWRQSPGQGVDVLVATLIPIIAWGSFFMASFLPGTGEEQMPHIVGIPLNLFSAGLLFFVTVLGYGLYRRGLQKET
jgi:hypothetical protein